MQVEVIRHPVDPKSFWRKLNSQERHKCMTWSYNSYGWKKIISFNPVDTYKYRPGQPLDSFQTFVNRNSGKFMIGFLSYDLGYELYHIQPAAEKDLDIPEIFFLAYDNFVVFDQGIVRMNFSDSSFPDHIMEIYHRPEPPTAPEATYRFEVTLEKVEYARNFRKIQEHIRAGDFYQLNYTHRMEATCRTSGLELFLYLLQKNPVNYAAFIESEDFSILSLSPESFVKVSGGKISTEPIKGTRPRGENYREDEKLKADLLQSEKEQAELFMITDLLRNDLGKVCKAGSVRVTEKKNVRKLPGVWHTFSKIEGVLQDNITPVESLLSMFPGGSITGCPKKRAMEVIDELEPVRRGVYTGSVGYILPNGDMEMNIAIRTVIKKDDRLYLGVGGGITIESQMQDEFDETLAKAKSFQND